MMLYFIGFNLDGHYLDGPYLKGSKNERQQIW